MRNWMIMIVRYQREILKDEFKSDVNSRLKSDPIIDIDFRKINILTLMHDLSHQLKGQKAYKQ